MYSFIKKKERERWLQVELDFPDSKSRLKIRWWIKFFLHSTFAFFDAISQTKKPLWGIIQHSLILYKKKKDSTHGFFFSRIRQLKNCKLGVQDSEPEWKERYLFCQQSTFGLGLLPHAYTGLLTTIERPSSLMSQNGSVSAWKRITAPSCNSNRKTKQEKRCSVELYDIPWSWACLWYIQWRQMIPVSWKPSLTTFLTTNN